MKHCYKLLKQFVFIGSILLLFFPVICMASIVAPPLAKFTILLDWFANPNHAPLFVAQQQGFFKQQGLDVILIGPSNPSDPPKLVAAGKADLAIDYQPQLLLQVQQGLPLVRVATLQNKPLDCLIVNATSNIKSMHDLKGKSIGGSSDSVDSAMLQAMLAYNGLSIKDITLINVNYDLSQALLAGKVDAVTDVMRNYELIQLQLAGFNARAFYPEDNGVPPYDELIIVANKLELSDPRMPRFLAALKEGEDYLQKNPETTWDVFAQNHPELNNELNKRAWFATLPYFAKDPAVLDVARYNHFAAFMVKQGLLQHPIPISNYAVQLTS